MEDKLYTVFLKKRVKEGVHFEDLR